jgi:hypothetical protein
MPWAYSNYPLHVLALHKSDGITDIADPHLSEKDSIDFIDMPADSFDLRQVLQLI